ncbi:MAG: hydroxylamine oxidoreductase [Candidatus Latescibacteria bacterium]|nr:hydroxylamine oxidoreductase [Candidatus Latescibacterota bacterium]
MKHMLFQLLGTVSFFCVVISNGVFGQEKLPSPQLTKEIEIGRGLTEIERECISCHAKEEPGKVHDWSNSLHARSTVTCLDCHRAELTDKDARDCPGTEKYRDIKISPVVTPLDCSKCHPFEEKQFSQSKHARTFAIQTADIKDPWLKGMNNEIERATGCYVCHGSDITTGELTVENWPNVGCGRGNPDGSHGSCVMCHTTHRFNIAEARKPETCGQCHLGPDHPQDEIYFESKHGKRYLAEHNEWNFNAGPDLWEPSEDFTAPTCAACHMSGLGPLATTHNVGERLKWEAERPLTILNKDFDGGKAREQMVEVCTQCHSPRWAKNYLERYDLAIENYNENYFKPVKVIMDDLYAQNLLTKWPMFDEEIEWAFYEFWHHEGRRARMGSAMMGPDYSWWHGFYDLKKTYQHIVKLAEEAKENGHGSPVFVPGSGGKNLTTDNVDDLPEGWNKVKNLKGRLPR